MKVLTTLLLLFTAVQLSAQDSVYVQFVRNYTDFSRPKFIFSNGNYALKKYPLIKDEFVPKEFLRVDPAQLTGHDNKLLWTTYSPKFADVPSYVVEYSPYHLKDTNSRNADLRDAVLNHHKSMLAKGYTADSIYGKIVMELTEHWYVEDTNRTWTQCYVKYNNTPLKTIAEVQQAEKAYRKSQQSFVDSILQPFYLKQTEVTNSQYRSFVEWTRDSLALKRLYDTLSFSEAVKLLNGSKKQKAAWTAEHKAEYLKQYGFNFELTKNEWFWYDEVYLELLKPMYYPQAERFYKRMEFDVAKFIYQTAGIPPTPVFPDTLCWLRDSTPMYFHDPMVNMYFWHPAYDNYPVVGLNPAQMKAYCDWYQRQLNSNSLDKSIVYEVFLPEVFHYECAAKVCAGAFSPSEVDVNPPKPAVFPRETSRALEHVVKVYSSFPTHEKYVWHSPKLDAWRYVNGTEPFYQLIGGVSEYCATGSTDSIMVALGQNWQTYVVDPNEFQLNTVFYKQELPTNRAYATVGFRPAVRIRQKTTTR